MPDPQGSRTVRPPVSGPGTAHEGGDAGPGRCYHRAMDILLVLILILVVVIIWRGPKTLPLLGKAFGQGVKEARKEIGEIKSDVTGGSSADDDAPKTS